MVSRLIFRVILFVAVTVFFLFPQAFHLVHDSVMTHYAVAHTAFSLTEVLKLVNTGEAAETLGHDVRSPLNPAHPSLGKEDGSLFRQRPAINQQMLQAFAEAVVRAQVYFVSHPAANLELRRLLDVPVRAYCVDWDLGFNQMMLLPAAELRRQGTIIGTVVTTPEEREMLEAVNRLISRPILFAATPAKLVDLFREEGATHTVYVTRNEMRAAMARASYDEVRIVEQDTIDRIKHDLGISEYIKRSNEIREALIRSNP